MVSGPIFALDREYLGFSLYLKSKTVRHKDHEGEYTDNR